MSVKVNIRSFEGPLELNKKLMALGRKLIPTEESKAVYDMDENK